MSFGHPEHILPFVLCFHFLLNNLGSEAWLSWRTEWSNVRVAMRSTSQKWKCFQAFNHLLWWHKQVEALILLAVRHLIPFAHVEQHTGGRSDGSAQLWGHPTDKEVLHIRLLQFYEPATRGRWGGLGKSTGYWDFPGSSAVKTQLPQQGIQIWSLVKELDPSHHN